MHGHMAFLIDFIILELASICSDFLMRYVCAKASANPVRSNNTNLASIRTILSAFTSVGRYLQSKLLNNALNFLFVYGISLIAKLSENPKIVPLEKSSVDTSTEHVKELEDELLKLRIENAFLKELRRLRLEDEAKMRERQESSAASEDSSN